MGTRLIEKTYKNPEWLCRASEDELRSLVRELDEPGDTAEEVVEKVTAALDRECARRAAEDYESRNNGEWI